MPSRAYLGNEHNRQEVQHPFAKLCVERSILLQSLHSCSHIWKILLDNAHAACLDKEPVSRPACKALYSCTAAASRRLILCDFSNES